MYHGLPGGAAEMMKVGGAREIHLAVTHGLFCGGAVERQDRPRVETRTGNRFVCWKVTQYPAKMRGYRYSDGI